jgi:SAM-dependent methyltransferase
MTVCAPPFSPSIATLYDRHARAVEDALFATLKDFARTVPAPRNDPFYGWDRRRGLSLRTMERMTAHGDFRKYVYVLDAGDGLGGIARWLSLTYGCRVLVFDARPRVAALARRLTERARLADRVRTVGAAIHAIPIRAASFTQIWGVELLHGQADLGGALRELHRVLRPGSTLALHEIVRRAPAAPFGGWSDRQ